MRKLFALVLALPIWLVPNCALAWGGAGHQLIAAPHSLGEVFGLGLCNLATCPMRMNLMPECTLHWQAF
jgi:hypothetical protein